MSNHYTFTISLVLEPSFAERHAEALDYLFSGGPYPTEAPPHHDAFANGFPVDTFYVSYRSFPRGSWLSQSWQSHDESGQLSCAGVNLRLPGNKFEGIWQDIVPLVQWLASMSLSQGCVGTIVEENDPFDAPLVIFILDRELYVGAVSTLSNIESVTTGAVYPGYSTSSTTA